MNYDVMGWMGGIMLAICSFPQAIMAYRQGHSDGISIWMLWLWGLGEVFTLIYIYPKGDLPLLVNYSANILCISVISWYRFRPRKAKVVLTEKCETALLS